MRARHPRQAKEKVEAKRKLAPITSGQVEFAFDDNFFLGDIFFPAATPPPVPVFTAYDSHPYFVAIDEINSVIHGMKLGDSFHELLLKGTAKAQRENLVHAKEQALYEHEQITIQELIDRIDRTLLQPSALTSDNLWDFRCPADALLKQAEEENKAQETLKRTRTDSTDNMKDLEYPADPILDGLDNFDAASTEAFYDIENFFFPPAPPAAPRFQVTTANSSVAKIISMLEENPRTESQKRPESPSSGEETISPTLEPVRKKAALTDNHALTKRFEFSLREKPKVNYYESRNSSRRFRK
ncbi:MAG TPA: hypothetical protein VGV92_09170 [Gammaproteobacteria bacterium]|nr:hypothetical protein [Gammaproteobacteria bacterium]